MVLLLLLVTTLFLNGIVKTIIESKTTIYQTCTMVNDVTLQEIQDIQVAIVQDIVQDTADIVELLTGFTVDTGDNTDAL